jgi:hypothetical protein
MKEPILLRCRDVTELATGYMDHTLPLRSRLAMRLHLSLCIACRTYMDQLKKTVGLLRDRPLGPPPPGLTERVIAEARLEAEKRQKDESQGGSRG